jgi:hypothetical protein
MVRTDNDIAIQCIMEYQTRDKDHEIIARLPEILVDGAIVMPQGSHTGMVDQWRATVAFRQAFTASCRVVPSLP